MSSGAQAQLAASQAASAASAEAAANALAFSKQIYGEQKTQRAPYLRGGEAGLQMLINLLGLQERGGLIGGGSGPGGSSGSLAGLARSATSGAPRAPGSTTGGGTTRTSTTTPPPPSMNKPPAGTPFFGNPLVFNSTTRQPGGPGFNEGAFRRFEAPLGQDDIPWQQPFDTAPVDKFGLTVVTDPAGNPKSVPVSLVPFYTARGFSVE